MFIDRRQREEADVIISKHDTPRESSYHSSSVTVTTKIVHDADGHEEIEKTVVKEEEDIQDEEEDEQDEEESNDDYSRTVSFLKQKQNDYLYSL